MKFNVYSIWAAIVILFFSGLIVSGQTVTTDQADYPPGSTVQITGSGFTPGEQVQLQVLNVTDPTDTGDEHAPWLITADTNGLFTTTWYVTTDEVGMTLQLTATGQTSSLVAQTIFTDSTRIKANNTLAVDTGPSWVGGTAPGTADIAQWDSTVTAAQVNTFSANVSWLGIKILNPGGAISTTVGNATVTLGTSGIDMTAATRNLTLYRDIILAGAQTWDVTNGLTLTIDISGGTQTVVNGGFQLTVQGAGNTTITEAISGTGGITKNGTGTLTLSGANSYTGANTINAGTLALGSAGSLASASSVGIAAGATFDVSGLGASATYTLGTSASLTASGTGTTAGTTAAVIKAGATGTVSLGSRPVSLTFAPTAFNGDTNHPSMYISQGTLSLNGNVFTVSNATVTALNAGTYRLIQQASGSITSAGSYSVSVTGTGLAANATASIQASGGNVNLIVKATPTFSGLTASQSIAYGTSSITLGGKVSATGPLYPTNGETITVTINGNAQTTTINDSTGDFSINYNPSTIPVSGSAYTISYVYAGNGSFNSATNTSTALTVNPGAASKLVFTSTAVTNTAGVASGTITVQRQDAFGNPNTADANRTVTLSSTSTGTVTFTPASLTIATGASSATFTYTDTQAGTPTITAASTSPTTITSATQVETISPAAASKLVFTSTAVTNTAGVASGTITVQRQDSFGNPNTADAARTVTLASTSTGTKTFTPASPLTIATGASSATFTYTDTQAGTPTITAASTSPTTITSVTQVETISPAAASKQGKR